MDKRITGSGVPFEAVYAGRPAWDIDGPQPAIVHLAERGMITGSVLDVGCGTGENALYLAARGHAVWGVDFVPLAIEKAQAKATERGLACTFCVHDALHLADLGRTFDTLIDCGLFHVFSDTDRSRFVESLKTVLALGGTYAMLCFSERQPGDAGPRRVTQAEIRDAFSTGWQVESIEPALFVTLPYPDGAHAWLSVIRRV